MAYAILRSSDKFEEISGAFTSGEGDEAVNHPAEWLDASTPTQRYDLSVYVTREPGAIPEGKREIGRRIEYDDGEPKRVLELEDISADELRADRVTRTLAERARRLATGFDYDFGDGRGVHRIGTTAEDMAGWDEVSKGASAAMALDMPDAPIGIDTDTGPVTVTAREWQMILLAASAARQPIYQASFMLQQQEPMPDDVENDKHWPK